MTMHSAQPADPVNKKAPEVSTTSGASKCNNIHQLRTQNASPDNRTPPQATNATTNLIQLPEGYAKTDGFICSIGETPNGPELEQLCSELDVVALIRNKDGRGWGRVIEAKDPDGNLQRIEIPYNADGILCSNRLADIGVSVIAAQKAKVANLISNWTPESRALRVSKGGWDEDLCYFVLGNEVFGKVTGADTVMFESLPGNHMFNSKGTLADWQEHIGRFCVGNSRLIFGVSMGLAGPLLKFGKEGGVGFHFYGKSSKGKTTLAKIAGSVVGGGVGGYLRTWRATDNGLEGSCLQHNDLLMVMDEIGQADEFTVSKSAYMIANGEEKARATKTGGLSELRRWQVIMLSTGEPRIASTINRTGQRIKAGQAVRFIDIGIEAGMDMGVVEDLHGFKSSQELVESLESACSLYYGIPIRAFIKKVVPHDRTNIITTQRKFVKEFVTECFPSGTKDTQARRVCIRFAEVAFAGETGITARILPWPKGTAREASLRLFQEWLDDRGEGALEDRSIIKGLQTWLQTRGQNHIKFDLNGADDDAECRKSWGNRGSYQIYGVLRDHGGEACYCLYPESLTAILEAEQVTGLDKDMVLDVLNAHGVLVLHSEKKGDKVTYRNTGKIQFNGSRTRMVIIKRSILDLEV